MRRWFAFHQDIGLQLLALYLLLIIPFLVTLWIFDGLIGVRIPEHVQASSPSLARSISQDVDLALSKARTTVEGLAKYPQVVQSDPTGWGKFFQVIINPSPDINLNYRLDARGVMLNQFSPNLISRRRISRFDGSQYQVGESKPDPASPRRRGTALYAYSCSGYRPAGDCQPPHVSCLCDTDLPETHLTHRGLTFLLIGLLFWGTLTLHMIRPIERLAPISEAKQQHLLSQWLRNDQIGHLIRSIVRMRDSIARHMREQAALLETSTAVVSTLDPESVPNRILEQMG